MTLRESVRQLLVVGVPQVGENWLEPAAASAETPTPFGILRVGEATAGQPWGGATMPIEAIPYAAPDSFVALDDLVAQTVAALDHVTVDVGGTPYLLAHEVAPGRDFYDEDWRAYSRTVRATAFALGWQTGLTYAPDPVASLRAWVAAQWPAQLQTDPATWDPSDATPGLYWRLAGVERADRGERSWGAWMDATLRAHVVAPSEAARLTWARQVVEALSYSHRLSPSDLSPLLFLGIAVDHEADPFLVGQVRLAARFGVLTPAPVPAPLPITQAPINLRVTADVG